MTADMSKFEYTYALTLDGEEFHVRPMIPYAEKEQMALDFISAIVIFDEKKGIAFEGYNADLIRAFMILVHYTDLDTASYDTVDGRQTLYDIIATHGLWPEIMSVIEDDLEDVDSITMRLEHSARRNFEQAHSLQYQVLKTFQSLLGTEDVTETIAKAEGLNGKLIDMLGALQREQASPVKAGGLQLAKKTEH